MENTVKNVKFTVHPENKKVQEILSAKGIGFEFSEEFSVMDVIVETEKDTLENCNHSILSSHGKGFFEKIVEYVINVDSFSENIEDYEIAWNQREAKRKRIAREKAAKENKLRRESFLKQIKG